MSRLKLANPCSEVACPAMSLAWSRFGFSHRGFTLLEVLVALIIMSLLLGGLYRSVDQQVDQRIRINERFLGQTASWNRLLDQYQLIEGWVPRGNRLGERDGSAELYGTTWYWKLDTQQTFGNNFFRYEVSTFTNPDTEEAPSVASLVAFFIVE